jgi:hypothetical protein
MFLRKIEIVSQRTITMFNLEQYLAELITYDMKLMGFDEIWSANCLSIRNVVQIQLIKNDKVTYNIFRCYVPNMSFYLYPVTSNSCLRDKKTLEEILSYVFIREACNVCS